MIRALCYVNGVYWRAVEIGRMSRSFEPPIALHTGVRDYRDTLTFRLSSYGSSECGRMCVANCANPDYQVNRKTGFVEYCGPM